MRRLSLTLMALSACTTQSSWLGEYVGTATLNDGRQPTTATGTLTIAVGTGLPSSYTFAFNGTLPGASKRFTCRGGLSTASTTASTATLATPAVCLLSTVPDDGCTHEVTFSSGEFALTADTVTGSGNGRLSTNCPVTGSSVSDFGFTVSASKQTETR